MKIEEVIEHSRYVAKRIREEEGLCVDDLNAHNCQDCLKCAKEYEQLAECLEELLWYRSQDLIRREVALSRTEDVYFAACTESERSWKCYLYDNCGECKTHQVELEIEQMPKAEPPKE